MLFSKLFFAFVLWAIALADLHQASYVLNARNIFSRTSRKKITMFNKDLKDLLISKAITCHLAEELHVGEGILSQLYSSLANGNGNECIHIQTYFPLETISIIQTAQILDSTTNNETQQ